MSEKHKKHHENEKLEAKIQNEIRRRILQEEEEIEEEKIHTEDIVEALKEITDVPHEEIERVAEQVRIEYSSEYEHNLVQKKKMRKVYLGGAVTALLLIIIFRAVSYYNFQKNQKIANISYEAVFTTGVSESFEPFDNLDEVSINIDKIYLYVKWRFLPKGNHKYQIRAFDGAGKVAWDSSWEFRSNDATHNTWSHYNPKENIDKPGKWKFEIFLDGRKIVEEYLSVVSE